MSDQSTTTEQLPAFLRRKPRPCDQCTVDEASGERTSCEACHSTGLIADGQLELVLHCTWVQDHYTCPRKMYLRYVERVESTGPRPALNYGAGIHAGKRVRFEWEMTHGPNQNGVAEYEPKQMEVLQQWFDKHPQPMDEWRNCGRAQDLIRAYNEHWPVHDWQVLAVEEEFEVEVGTIHWTYGDLTQQTPVYLAGRKDLVVAWQDHLWIVDHKTCSDWGSGDTNSHLDEGRRSFQFRGYAWAERARQAKLDREGERDMLEARNHLPIAGTIGNYLISRKPYATDKPARNGRTPLPRNQFHMECYPFESSVLDEWREECLDVAASILRDWQRGRWATHDTGCGHWGRCEFYDYCEEAPDRRAAMLGSSLFQPKVFEREL